MRDEGVPARPVSRLDIRDTTTHGTTFTDESAEYVESILLT
jgi:hypothetical protein